MFCALILPLSAGRFMIFVLEKATGRNKMVAAGERFGRL